MLKLQYQHLILIAMLKKCLLSFLYLIFSLVIFAQNNTLQNKEAAKWVKKQFRSLSMNEKIAQLMVLRAHSNWDSNKIDSLATLIKKYNVGGLCFFQGGPVREAIQTNNYQAIAKTPLLITMDAETGVGMRLDSVLPFPRQLALGAMPSEELVYQMGAAIAAQCKRLGIQVNYAPDVDINNNPLNPVINDRSFGQDKNIVASYALAYMKGLQENGVMATAKHFPGHGDVSVDSHLDIPVINKSRADLDSLELSSFRSMIQAGIGSVMVAHLSVPAIDNGEKRPTSLSNKAVNELLKKELGFKGIVVTDALDMKAISNYYPEGEANVQAILAGNDMLCLPGDIAQSIKRVRQAIREHRISRKDINNRVIKILNAKYQYGLSRLQPIDTQHIVEDLNQSVASLKKQMALKSLTFVRPTIKERGKRIAYIALNTLQPNKITNALVSKQNATIFYVDGKDENIIQGLPKRLADYDQVIVGLHSFNRRPANNFEIPASIIQFLNNPAHNNWIHIIMGNPYAVAHFSNINNILFAYEDNEFTQEAVVAWLEGKVDTPGKLPVTISTLLPVGKGAPLGLKIEKLNVIDSIVNNAIAIKAIPGCQVLVAKNNQIVYNKSFGNIAGPQSPAVTNATIYDLASVTKISATTMAIMKLVEEGKINIDKTIGEYLPWVRGNAKANITLRNLLLHQAGLYPYIKFYENLLDSKGNYLPGMISKTPDTKHQQMITPTKYLLTTWTDTIRKKILESPVTPSGSYVYSDNDFIFLGNIVEQVTGMNLHEYTTQQFYKPLQMHSTGFLPLQRVDINNIAASEEDHYFRNELIHGSVHDEGASTMGGIAGHAGLFSNATDLATLYLMLLNKGNWDGKQYLQAKTINEYTAYNTVNSRRGLGFDKPEKNNAQAKEPYPCASASLNTFGHTGYTGTCVWADPDHQLLYIFLSNRVYPTRDNKVFANLNLRPKIQEAIYSAIEN